MTVAGIEALLEADRYLLVERWRKMTGQAPPNRISRKMMANILATDFQWSVSGRSRAAMMRKLQRAILVAGSEKPNARQGNRLVREWNGRQYIVDVTSEGYVWKGRTWRSLSAIAKEITGTKWSGPRFFGVAG